MTMKNEIVKFKYQCSYDEYKNGDVNATTAAYPFKVKSGTQAN